MKERSVAVLMVGASVLFGAAAARAEETAGAAAGEKKELSGTVIKSEANMLYVEHLGAAVPMEIGRETRFSGVRSAAELAKGQEVRASFTVKNDTENIAEGISVAAPPTRSARERAPVGYQDDQDYGG